MAGFGSPCGACKFLRRKCERGCVFAPYFCHEQGPRHFAAIHKVFGASNVSKLLTHLPVKDRCEAAVTISYEAQARLQDPIYGCVSHIFALQQQVVSLQAQLASLKEQAVQGTPRHQEEKVFSKFSSDQHTDQRLFHLDEQRIAQQLNPNHVNNDEAMLYNDHGFLHPNHIVQYQNSTMRQDNLQFTSLANPSDAMASALDMQMNTQKSTFQDTEDLQAIAFSYIQNS